MLDLGFLRDNLPLVEQKLRDRGMDPREVLGDFHALDSERRKLITEAETLTAQRNRKSEEVAKLKKEKQNADALIAETKAMRERIEELNKAVAAKDSELQALLTRVPNLPHYSVPVGKTAEENVEVRRWGEPPKFDFAPKPHWDLGEQLGILDLERAAKITGARFAVYWEMGAQARARAHQFHARRAHARARLHRSAAAVHGEFGKSVRHRPAAQVQGRPVSSATERDFWLIPTAEVPVTNLYRDEDLDGDELPDQVSAPTLPASAARPALTGATCAASSASTSSRRWRLVKFARPEQSYDELEALTARRRETSCRRLGLPYRTWCSPPATWASPPPRPTTSKSGCPGRSGFKEISSCSNFEAFQARRADIRYRAPGKQEVGVRPHAQRQRPGRRTHLGGDPRKLPAERRQRRRPRSPAALHGR